MSPPERRDRHASDQFFSIKKRIINFIKRHSKEVKEPNNKIIRQKYAERTSCCQRLLYRFMMLSFEKLLKKFDGRNFSIEMW